MLQAPSLDTTTVDRRLKPVVGSSLLRNSGHGLAQLITYASNDVSPPLTSYKILPLDNFAMQKKYSSKQ